MSVFTLFGCGSTVAIDSGTTNLGATVDVPDTQLWPIRLATTVPEIVATALTDLSDFNSPLHVNPSNDVFRAVGGAKVPLADGSLGYSAGRLTCNGEIPPSIWQFDITGSSFDWFLSQTPDGYFRMWIDGALYTREASFHGESRAIMKQTVKFSSAQRRHIAIELEGSAFFFGVNVPNSLSEISAPVGWNLGPKVAVMGDSFTEGAVAEQHVGYPMTMAALTQWQVQARGCGGTGYVNPGAGAAFPDRLSDVTADKPSVVIVFGGLNDWKYSADQIRAAAKKTFEGIEKELPDAKILVIAPTSMCTGSTDCASGGFNAGEEGVNAVTVSIKAAIADTKADGFKHTELVADPMSEKWVTGSPYNLYSGNAYLYTSIPYFPHPTQLGHDMLAQKIAQKIANLYPSLILTPTK